MFVNAKTKSIGFVGEFEKCSHKAVVVVEKKSLSQSDVKDLISQTQLTQNFTNDIYAQYDASCRSSIGNLKVIVISPATDAHVQKYLDRDLHFIHETTDDYESITKPFVQRQVLSLDWVYNILDGHSESDRIICNDPDPVDGFVLLPDMKWDSIGTEYLHVLAIARRRGIPSMRELRTEHLPLLRNILVKGKQAIKTSYSVDQDQLRVYVHYQPSYYHFHVHFTHVKYEAPGSLIGQSHLLDDVIDNISCIDSLYYQKRTLSFVVKEGTPLWTEYSARFQGT